MGKKLVNNIIIIVVCLILNDIMHEAQGYTLPENHDYRRNTLQQKETRMSSHHRNSSHSDTLTSMDFLHDFKNTLKTKNLQFAGGMVSVDCLRCLCLKLSNCEPIGCKLSRGTVVCGYFQLTKADVLECKVDSVWEKCANDVTCSSLCVQRYMELYVKPYNCVPSCEAYSRELYGGPNGCNNPRTLPFWNAVQEVPGCRGVM